MQSGAAKEAAAKQQDAAYLGITTQQAGARDALAYLDPYRNLGLTAGYAMNNMLYSPDQIKASTDTQRIALQGEIDRLKSTIPQWETYQTFTGKNASERRRDAFHADLNSVQTKIREAEAKLATFDKQAQLQATQAQAGPPKLEASPWYQFQAELLGRTMDRHFAARGLSGSGFEAEEKRRGLIELGAGETERQFTRMNSMYNAGLNAATAGAGAITGTSQGIANMQVGAGNAAAQGIIGSGNAWANTATGVGNAVNGAVGAGLNYNMFNNLMARNKPTGTASLPTGTMASDAYIG
jgi:hypothetical protein